MLQSSEAYRCAVSRIGKSTTPPERMVSFLDCCLGGPASELATERLQPTRAFESDEERQRRPAHQQQGQRVTEPPGELGHLLEIHAVDACDHRWNRDDGCPGCQPALFSVL